MRKTFILIFLFLTLYPANSELKEKMQQKWRWVKFGVQSGLPSDKNVKIVEAMDGTVWACTPKGFAWYDGYIWHKVPDKGLFFKFRDINLAQPNHKNGLIAPFNGKLAIITSENIVIQTLSYKGNKVYIREVQTFDNKRLLLHLSLKNMNFGELFIYSNGHLEKLDDSPKIDIFPSTDIYLYKDRLTNFWLNSRKGFYLYYNKQWKLKLKNYINEPYDICKPIMNKTGNGFIAIGFPAEFKGVWKLNNNTDEISFVHSYETSLYDGDMDNNGNVVTVHIGGFCEIYENGIWDQLTELPIEINNAIRVLFTNNDNLWISSEKGLYLCNLSSDRFKYIYFNDNLQNNYINEIIKVQSDYWFASGNGIHTTKELKHCSMINKINNTELKGITALIDDKYGNIWIGSGAHFPGAFKWDRNNWSKVNIGEFPEKTYIHKIRKDRKNDLWFLTISARTQQAGYGAYQFKDNKFIHWDTSNGLINNRVFDFIEDSSGSLWFATFGGLCRYKNKKWSYWTMDNGLRYGRVYDITLDKDNKLWFTDFKYGIGCIQNDSVIYNEQLDNAELLRAATIVFDKTNKLWISTSSGLYIKNKDAISYFNKENGLLKTAIWPLLVEEDRTIIGTSGGGLNILSLKEKNEPLPRIYLKYNGESNGIYHISWNVYSYWGQISSEDIQVRYRLDNGTWSNWNLTRELKINDIEYGDHKFEIQAKGLFGDYKGTQKCILFKVDYPFYFSPFFIVPLVAFFFIAVGYRYNYNKKKKEVLENTRKLNFELNDKVEQQTRQLGEALRDLKAEIMIRKLAEEELIIAKNNISKAYYKEKELNVLKSNTFSAISQEFKDPLTIIATSAELLEYYYSQNNLTGFKDKISNIRNSTGRLFNVIEEIIIAGQFESNRIELIYEKFDIINLINDIINNYSQHFKFKHQINLETDVKDMVIESDQTFIRHIVTNLLSNAIKFSPENSKIIVEVVVINSKLAIKIRDKGIGIPPDIIEMIYEPFIRGDNVKQIAGTGFGLTVVKRAVELLGGEILCSSVVNEGSIFSVYLPLDSKQI